MKKYTSWSEATSHPLDDITAASEGARSAFAALGDAGRRGADAGNRWKMTILLWVVRQNLRSLKRYQLPPVKFTDHLKDCFGFLCYNRHDRFNEFVDAFHKALIKDMPWLKGMGL